MPVNTPSLDFELIVNSLNRGIYCTDTDGRCTFISHAAAQLLGYSMDYCIGKNMHQLVHHHDVNGNLNPKENCPVCNPDATESRDNEIFWKADGTWFYVRYSCTALVDKGIVKGAVMAFSDITEQKQKEGAIIESERRYKLLFEDNPLPMFVWDFESLQIVDCNEEAMMKYGYTREEFLQLNLTQVRPPEDVQLIKDAVKNETVYGKVHKRIWRHLKKSGELMYVEVTGHLINFNGRRASLVLVNDLTEKLKAESELKNSEEKLRIATKIAGLGYWQVQLDGQNRYWSDEVYTIWGATRDAFKADYSLFYKTIHPDDREKFTQEQAFSVTGKKEIDFEYRIILPDGTIKWVHEIGKLVPNKDGGVPIFQGTVQDITPQKLMSISLEEANLRYDYVTQATSDAIWDWDMATDHLYWGEGIETIFGYKLAGVRSTVSSWADNIHPDDAEQVVKGIYAVVDGTETNWKDEYRYRKANGQYAYVVDRGFVIRNAKGEAVRMVGAIHDITKRKTQVHHLKLLESVITHATDAVLITDADFTDGGPRIVYINEAFTQMTGYTAEEVTGKTPKFLQGPKSDMVELARLSTALRNSEPCEITIINYKKNGEEFWINFAVNPVTDDKGMLTHFVAIERDVTGRKKAELDLEQFAEDLYKRNKELNQFGYIVSHNLRSPVANIMGIVNLLELDSEDPETVEKCTGDLKTLVHRLDSVIKDLSQILSITDGSAALNKEKINLNELIAQVSSDMKQSIDDAGAVINIIARPCIMHSNKAYLYSVFYNLISNALKYRSAIPPVINISIECPQQLVIVKLADNGVGIDMERHKENVFQPYKRFDTTVDGKGLGLFLVKSHVEALGGSISIESELGRGTAFIINLPLANTSVPVLAEVGEIDH